MAHRLLVRNAAQLVTICSHGERVKAGSDMHEVEIIQDGALVVGADGRIVAVGTTDDIMREFEGAEFDKLIDASGKAILPGFVDCHTHPVWSGDRTHEFEMKLSGATYMDIHRMGGGIAFTVKNTRESSEEELLELLLKRLRRMLAFGTTCIEAKSGYGLDFDTEMKMLRVLEKAKALQPIEIVSTYLEAHSVPEGKTSAERTEEIVADSIPRLAKLMERKEVNPKFIDVFCEKGVFSSEETKRILDKGKEIGLDANFHGDELHPMEGGSLCKEIGATAMSHCECTSEGGRKSMKEAGTVAVVLPTTSYLLRIEHAPARSLVDEGVVLALATDYNPNAHCLSIPRVMNLSCILLRLTMAEALNAVTLNAAASIGLSGERGSLEVGKVGDMVILDADLWGHIVYEFEPPIESVLCAGKVVYEKKSG